MSFKDEIRENFHEKPKNIETDTLDSRTDEVINYIKEFLLDCSKKGSVKEVGSIFKKRYVECKIMLDYEGRHFDKNHKVPYRIVFGDEEDLYRNTWRCPNILVANAFYVKIASKCVQEGISISKKQDLLDRRIYCTCSIKF